MTNKIYLHILNLDTFNYLVIEGTATYIDGGMGIKFIPDNKVFQKYRGIWRNNCGGTDKSVGREAYLFKNMIIKFSGSSVAGKDAIKRTLKKFTEQVNAKLNKLCLLEDESTWNRVETQCQR